MEKIICRYSDKGKPIIEIYQNLDESEIEELTQFTFEYKVKHFVINEKVTDITFLNLFKSNVEILIILDPDEQLNISPIEELTNLEILRIREFKKQKFDLSKLNKLKKLFIHWNNEMIGFSQLNFLEVIEIYNYKLSDSSLLELPASLSHLVFISSRIENLGVLNNTPCLKQFELHNCMKIKSLSGIEKCLNINEITLYSCPELVEIDDVAELKKLKKIVLENCKSLKSVEALRCLPLLEEPIQLGSTKAKW